MCVLRDRNSLSQTMNKHVPGSKQVYIYGIDRYIPGNGYAFMQGGRYFNKDGRKTSEQASGATGNKQVSLCRTKFFSSILVHSSSLYEDLAGLSQGELEMKFSW